MAEKPRSWLALLHRAAVQLTLALVIWLRLVGVQWLLWVGLALLLIPHLATLLFRLLWDVEAMLEDFVTPYTKEGCLGTVVESGGKIVGFLLLRKDKDETDTAELYHILVEPSHRWRGLGQRLCQQAEEFCLQHSYKSIFLYSLDRFKPAHRLYERMGYKHVDTMYVPELGGVLKLCALFVFRKHLVKKD